MISPADDLRSLFLASCILFTAGTHINSPEGFEWILRTHEHIAEQMRVADCLWRIERAS